MNDKFWAVWRQSGGGATSRKHETKEDALKEAQRLAAHTNEAYFVLEVIGIVAPKQVPVEFTEIK